MLKVENLDGERNEVPFNKEIVSQRDSGRDRIDTDSFLNESKEAYSPPLKSKKSIENVRAQTLHKKKISSNLGTSPLSQKHYLDPLNQMVQKRTIGNFTKMNMHQRYPSTNA